MSDKPQHDSPALPAAPALSASPTGQDSALTRLGVSEGRMLALVAAVQFVNILDFMMVMPLGPDFASDLHIPTSNLGLVGGSYTAAAAIAGLLGSRFLDRFDRRSALAVAMLGLVAGTAMGGFAVGMRSLMAARVVAGCFGGPATSLALSIVADVVPPARRGRALGLVMGAFTMATVFGVPAGLELARLGSWRTPFFAVAGMGLLVAASAIFLMPSLRLHLDAARQKTRGSFADFISDRTVQLSLLSTFSVMMAAFSVTPNFSAYLQHNLGYPREHLGILYLVGGSVSFITMQLVGRIVDRFGAASMALVGTVFFVGDLYLTFVAQVAWLPVMAIFVTFMTSMALRNVPLNTLSSRVPALHERARFMSIQSAVQHIASALGAISSSHLLRELPDKRLDGMSTVATISIALGVLLPFLLFAVERRVKQRESAVLPSAERAA